MEVRAWTGCAGCACCGSAGTWGISPSVRIEARRWTSKGAAAFAESAGGTGACVASLWGSRSCCSSAVLVVVLLMYAQDIAVVAFASFWVGEDGVGFGDLGEARGGVWVGFVDVRVGEAGEGVELFL